MRLRGATLWAVVGAVTAGAVSIAVVAASDGSDDVADGGPEWGAVIEDARTQLEHQAFSGTLVVLWRDDRGRHRMKIDVHHAGGVTTVDAPGTELATDAVRVVGEGRTWAALAGSALGSHPPLASRKYDTVQRAGPPLAGRSTVVYEARRGDVPVGSVYLDAETGLVLKRETFERDGTVRRAVWFERLEPLPRETAGSTLPPQGRTPTAVVDVEEPLRDPEEAGDGFRLLGRFRHPGGLWHLYYSDGLVGVSVFEQPGTLDWDALPPGGAPARVGGERARHYSLPVGDVWVFEHDGVVYTGVADAPAGEALAVVADVAGTGSGGGTLERLGRLVLAPLRW